MSIRIHYSKRTDNLRTAIMPLIWNKHEKDVHGLQVCLWSVFLRNSRCLTTIVCHTLRRRAKQRFWEETISLYT